MNYIFANCGNLNYLNLWNFHVSHVEYMISSFEGCSKLQTIDGLNQFNPQNLKNMAGMFSNCKKIDLGQFDTSQVTDMNSLFNNCESLSTLIIHFNTEKVNNMEKMFNNCKKIINVELNNFDTSLVTNTVLWEQQEVDV